MTAAKLRLTQAAMGKPETRIAELCAELGVTRQTLYRHVTPTGELRPDGEKLLGRKSKPPRSLSVQENAVQRTNLEVPPTSPCRISARDVIYLPSRKSKLKITRRNIYAPELKPAFRSATVRLALSILSPGLTRAGLFTFILVIRSLVVLSRCSDIKVLRPAVSLARAASARSSCSRRTSRFSPATATEACR